ncbi:MAG: hypothetical protein AB1465_00910 [Patescibacteria group bacterium]
MDQKEAFIKAIKILKELKMPYMIVGGFAVSFWGEPRSTHDLDIAIEIKSKDKNNLIKIFRKNGYYIDEVAIEEAVDLKKMFNVIHPESELKIDFWIIGDDLYSREKFKRRVGQKIFNQNVFLASPEDMILMKLEWFKKSQISKHFLDARGIYKLQNDIISQKYLKKWAIKLGLLNILDDLMQK